MHIQTQTHIHTETHTHTHMHTQTQTHTHIHTHTHTYTHKHTHTHKYTYIHRYIHTYIRTYKIVYKRKKTFRMKEFRREWQGVASDLYGGNAFLLQLRYCVIIVSAQLAISKQMNENKIMHIYIHTVFSLRIFWSSCIRCSFPTLTYSSRQTW